MTTGNFLSRSDVRVNRAAKASTIRARLAARPL